MDFARIANKLLLLLGLLLGGCLIACQPQTPNQPDFQVLAVESFLADIAQNVAGDRVKVDTLMPKGVDPHTFEPTPRDVAKIAESDVLILNGAGLEAWLDETLQNAGGQRVLVEAASGLSSRTAHGDEPVAHDFEGDKAPESEAEHAREGDPHFWLNPLNVITYVENIREGLSAADPAGKAIYTQNAAAYIEQLKALDQWIQSQVAQVPAERRLIVTNHESFGYFADRYGFKVIGAIIPSVSAGASPSAQQMARLVDQIRSAGVTVIFLETGTNPQLAEQIAQETGIRVISDLYTHSLSQEGGNAPTYIDMMKYNVRLIVETLK